MTDTATESQPTEAPYGEAMGALFELMGGFMTGHVLRTGLELGIFEVLDSEPQAAAEIASELELESEHTYRLLRALAQTDFVTEEPGEAFSLAPLGRYLEDDPPGFDRGRNPVLVPPQARGGVGPPPGHGRGGPAGWL